MSQFKFTNPLLETYLNWWWFHTSYLFNSTSKFVIAIEQYSTTEYPTIVGSKFIDIPIPLYVINLLFLMLNFRLKDNLFSASKANFDIQTISIASLLLSVATTVRILITFVEA